MPTNPIRFLTDAENPGDGPRGLVLEKFSDELLFSFLHSLNTAPLQRIKDLVGTDTYAWPVFGELPTEYHKVGDRMEGDDAPSIMRRITVDDRLVYKFALADFDAAMADWEVRSEYTSRGGIKLAQTWELNTMAARILSSRSASFQDPKTGYTFSGGGINVSDAVSYGNGTPYVNTTLTDANKHVKGIAMLDSIEEGAINFAQRNIPEGEWYAAMGPRDFSYAKNAITNSGNGAPLVLNKDFKGTGLAPGFNEVGEMFEWNGVKIIKQTKGVFGTVVNSGPAQYQGDYSTTRAIMWHPAATATVRLMGMATEQARDTKAFEDFTVVSMAVGTNVLRPECALEITDAALV